MTPELARLSPPLSALEFAFLRDAGIAKGTDLATAAAAMLFVAGPTGELSRFLAVRLGPFRSLYFDEPRDGLVYAATGWDSPRWRTWSTSCLSTPL